MTFASRKTAFGIGTIPPVAPGMVQPALGLFGRLAWRRCLPWLVLLACGAALTGIDRLLDARRRRDLAVEEAFQARSFRLWARVVEFAGASREKVSYELNARRPLLGPEGPETLNLAAASPADWFQYGHSATRPSHRFHSFRTAGSRKLM